MVKFSSIDQSARTVTFDVDGKPVTRGIPKKFDGTLDDYVLALARGLSLEYAVEETPKSVDSVSFAAGEELA